MATSETKYGKLALLILLLGLFGRTQEHGGFASEAERIDWFQRLCAAWPHDLEPDYADTGFKPERFRAEPLPPFTHPRVLFGPGDLPEIRGRLKETESGRRTLDNLRRHTEGLDAAHGLGRLYAGLAKGEDSPTIDRLLAQQPAICTIMLWRSFVILVDDDAEAAKRHAVALTSLAKRVQERFNRLDTTKMQMYENLAGLPPEIAARIPGTKDYQGYWMDIYNGAYAIQYDFLYNWMTEEQRGILRQLIADTTGGIWTHGMGQSRTGGNWGPCHWVGPLQHMCIEGEPGYDPKVFPAWLHIFKSFHSYDFSDQGVGFEPLGKGAIGSSYLPYFARRGYDIAAYAHVPRVMNRYMLHSKEPFADAFKTGGGLGTAMGRGDAWTVIFTKHLYPDDPLIEYVYRCVVGDDYGFSSGRWSTHFAGIMYPVLAALYCEDYDAAKSREDLLREGNAPRSLFCPQGGVMIARTAWVEDALWVHFKVNTALSMGHLAWESGHFTFSAHGRVWGDYQAPNTGGPMGNFVESRFFSLVNIDRLGNSGMPNSVVDHAASETAEFATADLSNGWNWRPADPNRQADAVPWTDTIADTLPLYQSRIPAYTWSASELEHWRNVAVRAAKWKAPHIPVKRAFRSVGLVRQGDAAGYLVIADDYRQDDQDHLYEWFMQTPLDVVLRRAAPGNVVLGEADGDRRLLVRQFYAHNGAAADPQLALLAGYGANQDNFRRNHCNRLRLAWRGQDFTARTILVPLKPGENEPTFTWDPGTQRLTITRAGSVDVLGFTPQPDGRSAITIVRDGESVFALGKGGAR